MPAVQVVIGSALTIIVLALLIEMTLLVKVLFKYFKEKTFGFSFCISV